MKRLLSLRVFPQSLRLEFQYTQNFQSQGSLIAADVFVQVLKQQCEQKLVENYNYQDQIDFTSYQTLAQMLQNNQGMVDFEIFLEWYVSAQNIMKTLSYIWGQIHAIGKRNNVPGGLVDVFTQVGGLKGNLE